MHIRSLAHLTLCLSIVIYYMKRTLVEYAKHRYLKNTLLMLYSLYL